MSGDRFKNPNIHALTQLDDPSSDDVQSLIDENRLLRETLKAVSSAGIVMMHRSHPHECASFTGDFMRAVIEIAEGIKISEVSNIFSNGLHLATQPSTTRSALDTGDKH